MRSIDIHAHISPEAYNQAAARGEDWYGIKPDAGSYNPRTAWSPELRLADMDSLGVDVHVLSTNAFFYNQFYVHWIWTLVTFAVVLEVIVRTLIARLRRQASRPPSPQAPRSNGEPVHRFRRIAHIPGG